MITFSGGEPLLHPELDAMIARMRASAGMFVTLITNGYYLLAGAHRAAEPGRPRPPADQHRQRGARRGLDEEPAAAGAEAPVAGRARRVLAWPSTPWWAAASATRRTPWPSRAARASSGFTSSVGHHPRRPRPAPAAGRRARWRSTSSSRRCAAGADPRSTRSSRTTWPAAARTTGAAAPGARYLYVDEDGLVHYCSQQRGVPGIPLEAYTRQTSEREYGTEEGLRPLLHGQLRAAGGARSTTGARRRGLRDRRRPAPARDRPPPRRRVAADGRRRPRASAASCARSSPAPPAGSARPSRARCARRGERLVLVARRADRLRGAGRGSWAGSAAVAIARSTSPRPGAAERLAARRGAGPRRRPAGQQRRRGPHRPLPRASRSSASSR